MHAVHPAAALARSQGRLSRAVPGECSLPRRALNLSRPLPLLVLVLRREQGMPLLVLRLLPLPPFHPLLPPVLHRQVGQVVELLTRLQRR